MCDARQALVVICVFDLILLLGFAAALGWKAHEFKGCKSSYSKKSCNMLAGYYAIYAIAVVFSLIRNIIGWTMACGRGGFCSALFYLLFSISLIVVGVCFFIFYYDYNRRYRDHWIVDMTFGAVLLAINLMCSIIGSALMCGGA